MSGVDPFELPADDPEDAAATAAPVPDALRREHDERLERMQTPEAREAAQRAFDASPEELGRAAALAAKPASSEVEGKTSEDG